MLFTFPSRYCCTIGRDSSLALESGLPSFPPACSWLVVLRMPARAPQPSSTGLSPSLIVRSRTLEWSTLACCWSSNPTTRACHTRRGLGSSRFARHYYGNLMLISFRRATEMFQLAHDPPLCLCIQHRVSRHHSGGVAPLGVSGLIACRQLPLNVSPVAASFFGLSHQGIHLARIFRLLACHVCCGETAARSRAMEMICELVGWFMQFLYMGAGALCYLSLQERVVRSAWCPCMLWDVRVSCPLSTAARKRAQQN